jgi:hypothetical protein
VAIEKKYPLASFSFPQISGSLNGDLLKKQTKQPVSRFRFLVLLPLLHFFYALHDVTVDKRLPTYIGFAFGGAFGNAQP